MQRVSLKVVKDRLSLDAELHRKGGLKESQNLLLKLLSKYPNDSHVNYQCASAYDALGQESRAIPLYKRAIANGLSGKDLEGAYIGLGSSYRVIGEYQKAIRVLRRAIKQHPLSRVTQVFLANRWGQTGGVKS